MFRLNNNSDYSLHCPCVEMCVPSDGSRNFVDWKLLVKEHNVKIAKLRNPFFGKVYTMFRFKQVWFFYG